MHVILCLLLTRSIAKEVTLTAYHDGTYVKGAKVNILSPSTVDIGSNTFNIIVNQDSDEWALWITMNNTWGYDTTSPSRFTMTLPGNTISNTDCDMLLSFTDGLEAFSSKYFTMIVRLDGNGFNMIAPGCDSNLLNPTKNLLSGDVYLVMAPGQYQTPGNRACRPAYINTSRPCDYDDMGAPSDATSWPLTFIIENYPAQNRMTVTFEGNGYNATSCAFNEHIPVNTGHNIYITGQSVSDNYEITQILLKYELLSQPTTITPTTTTPTTTIPTTMTPTTLTPTTTQTTPPTTTTPTTSTPTTLTPTTTIPTTLTPTTSTPTTTTPTTSTPTTLTETTSAPTTAISTASLPTPSPSTVIPTINPTTAPTKDGVILIYGILISVSFDDEVDVNDKDKETLIQFLVDIINATYTENNLTHHCIRNDQTLVVQISNNGTAANATIFTCDVASRNHILSAFANGKLQQDLVDKAGEKGIFIEATQININIVGDIIVERNAVETTISNPQTTLLYRNGVADNNEYVTNVLISTAGALFVCVMIICAVYLYHMKKAEKLSYEISDLMQTQSISASSMKHESELQSVSSIKTENKNVAIVNVEHGLAVPADKKTQVTNGDYDDIKINFVQDMNNKLEIKSWLENTVELGQYYDVFVNNGYESMISIQEIMDKSELNEIGIVLKSHQIKIMAEIHKVKKEEAMEEEIEGMVKLGTIRCHTPNPNDDDEVIGDNETRGETNDS